MSTAEYSSLLAVLDRRAQTDGGKTAFTYQGVACTFENLWMGINRFAAFLIEKGITGQDRILIALPNSEEFFFAFYGVQRAGGIAVPVFPGSGAERMRMLAESCGAKLIVLPSSFPTQQVENSTTYLEKNGLSIIRVSQSHATQPNADFPQIDRNDVSFLQYTSGSTGNPKGVMLTHDNLLTNIQQMIAGMEITERDIFVSWLPVYHDMGLILKTMLPFCLAAPVHLLPTDLRSVRRWLNTIQEQRATFTAAPDIAYRLCLRHVNPDEFDLSSLRVALNAAEPVRASTIRQFEKAFGLKHVMVAGYGLAEATVGVSMQKPGSAPRVDQHGHVSVGHTFPGAEAKIVQDGNNQKTGEIGEIAIKSLSNSSGYFNNPAATDGLFLEDGYLLTGDLGYLDKDGYLYIVGRLKNIIKRFGETISPQEIEEFIDFLPDVRMSAAVGIEKDGTGGEQVYVFAEVRGGPRQPVDKLFSLAVNIVQEFYKHMGFRPGRVYLLKPHAIPKTYNGKIQHGLLKESYLDNSLRESGRIYYPDY
jgi:fatty-acyl-CoA synthase